MKKLDLNEVAREFEMISLETHVYYNKETGKFDFNMDFVEAEYDRSEMFEGEEWIAAPDVFELGEYDIMVAFADSITDPRANELLSLALDGKGAFRRFRDALYRVNLEKEWYAFRHDAFVVAARRWCEDEDIPYFH
jgi:hypothetical protein